MKVKIKLSGVTNYVESWVIDWDNRKEVKDFAMRADKHLREHKDHKVETTTIEL